MSGSLRFSLILPTKNEIEGLKAILPKINRSLFHEIIVVDGHSTDGTPEFARAEGLKVVMQPGKGLPDAVEAAYRAFTGDVYVMFTPDGNSKPECLPPLMEKMNEGYDLVIVSRYLGNARSEDDDVLTGPGNWMFTTIVNILFRSNFTDSLVGYRAYTRSAIEKMHLPGIANSSWLHRRWYHLNSWELGSSTRAQRAGLRVAEIPGDEPKRIGGVRKMSIIKNGLGAVGQILWDFFTFWPKKS